MSRRFDLVDIAAVKRPMALEDWSFDAILDARFSKFLDYWAAERAKNPNLPDYDVTRLVGNPGSFHQRVDAFREGLVRQRVNEAVLATFLLFAVGLDLDARAADYNTVRAEGESDASLRLRALLAWENLSIGGSYGGYEYQARSAAPVDIADCAVYGHEVAGVDKGEVRVVVLGSVRSGALAPGIVDRVTAQLGRRDIRKVNDRITVAQAQIVGYHVDATLIVPRGADGQLVRDAKLADAKQYAAQRRRIGAAVTYNGLMNALGDDDPNVVFDVEMRAPFAGPVDPALPPRIGGGDFEAPVLGAVTLDYRLAGDDI